MLEPFESFYKRQRSPPFLQPQVVVLPGRKDRGSRRRTLEGESGFVRDQRRKLLRRAVDGLLQSALAEAFPDLRRADGIQLEGGEAVPLRRFGREDQRQSVPAPVAAEHRDSDLPQ